MMSIYESTERDETSMKVYLKAFMVQREEAILHRV